jgi:Carbohydrate family 9 binding domain-like
MKIKKYVWFSLLAFYLIPGPKNMNSELFGANIAHDSVTVKKCQDFKITGNGLSDQWQKAGWITLVQQEPNPLYYETKVKVLYSETGIYFLFNCEDKKLTSTMKADYLNLWEEDVVEAFLWTDENFPVYFEYELSPFNFELPIMVPNNKGNFLGWLPWHYEGDRKTRHATIVSGGRMESGSTISGWTAEFFIPYKLLAPLSNVPPVSGTRWRANLYRVDHDNGEVAYCWQKTIKTFHEYNKFGIFIFE